MLYTVALLVVSSDRGALAPIFLDLRTKPHARIQAVRDEWWDLVDETGTPTGAKWRRGDSGWPDGEFHLTVGVCAFRRDGRLLLTRRATTKSNPLEWEFPAGSVQSGEGSKQAATRELAEETGLKVDPNELRRVIRLVEPSALLDIYIAGPISQPVTRFNVEEVAEGHWLTQSQILELLLHASSANPWKYRLADYWGKVTAAMESVQHEFR